MVLTVPVLVTVLVIVTVSVTFLDLPRSSPSPFITVEAVGGP
jgi:hypothetical protein